MNALNTYAIAYKGIGDGTHQYEFDIGDAFFAAFEGTDIKGGNLEVAIDFTKRGSLMLLEIEIAGEVNVECDRCLEVFSLPIEYGGELSVREGEVEGEDDEDVMWLTTGEENIPLANYIYESIYLSLPYQRVHPDDDNGTPQCDPQMLAKFKIVTQQELEELVGNQSDEDLRPQMQKLAQLKKELEQKE